MGSVGPTVRFAGTLSAVPDSVVTSAEKPGFTQKPLNLLLLPEFSPDQNRDLQRFSRFYRLLLVSVAECEPGWIQINVFMEHLFE